MLRNITTGMAGIAALVALAGCAGDPASTTSSSEAPAVTSASHATSAAAAGGGQPGGGGPTRTVTPPPQGPARTTHPGASDAGSWDRNGNPVNGGPKGADGSTGNNLTKKHCAQNQDPACPAGSYVGANAILSPDGSGNYTPCEGSVCTNPNHGGGNRPTGNGGAPTTSAQPAPARDDDPAGKPCTTGMGVAGTYIYSEDTNSWVCQIG